MIDKPQDIAIIIGLFGLGIVGMAIFIGDLNTAGAGINDSFYNTVESQIIGQTDGAAEATLKGSGADAANALSAAEGSSDETSSENFIVAGFRSIVQLGKTWGVFKKALFEIQDILGISPFYLTIIISIITISFAVVVYTWVRGS